MARPLVWILVLLLAWVALASGMAASRAALQARNQAQASGQFRLSRSGSFVVSGATPALATRVQGSLAAPVRSRAAALAPAASRATSAVTLTPSVPGLATSAPPTVQLTTPTLTIGPNGAGPTTRISVNGSGGLTIFSGPTTASWSAVNWQTWATLGLWAALALFALGVLASAIANRGRMAREGPSRLMVRLAGVAFGLYAAGQVYLFVRDLTG
jgi:hypothetical protein